MDPVFADGTEVLVNLALHPKEVYSKVIESWYDNPKGFSVHATSSGMLIRFTRFLTKEQKAELLELIKNIDNSRHDA